MTSQHLAPIERLHGSYVQRRRLRRLSDLLARTIPQNSAVLDVGCGDGELTRTVADLRPDLSVRGIDVLVRDDSHIPVQPFDGKTIPYADAAFDVVMLIDVVHHADDPMALLREATRVARRALVIKDHLLQGPLANATLRFMDRVGNARYGVALPHNYWTPEMWREAFGELGLRGPWQTSLQLYPWPAAWVFERSLHFLACLKPASEVHGESAADQAWEAAYVRFETQDEEIRKFTRRLEASRCAEWSRDAEIVELFCGRGSSLHALDGLGFRNIEGVDVSPTLAHRYRGSAQVHIADCRQLPFAEDSKDIVIVQGGLHHLLELPSDLRRTLAEAHRVLRQGGIFVAVEPWMTPTLRFIHGLCRNRLVRALLPKVDALGTMIELEEQTYFAWLAAPEEVLAEVERFFEVEDCEIRWGKIRLRGRRRDDVSGSLGT